MKSLGIIGFGSFMRFFSPYLEKHFNLVIYNRNLGDSSLNDVLECEIIILAMPVNKIEEVLIKIKDKIKPNTIVLDICSVKEYPCQLMNELLPEGVEIIGTHPMFGPQSGKNGIEGLNIVLCDIRSKSINFFKDFFSNELKLNVFIKTPKEHDKQMAISQALTHFIGRISKNLELDRIDLSTKTYDDLINILKTVRDDSDELFLAIQNLNPYAKEIREKFIDEANRINNKLND